MHLMEESITRETNESKCKQDKGFPFKKKFCTNANAKNIRALYVAKEWEGTPCSVQNVNTGCTRGVLEFMEV